MLNCANMRIRGWPLKLSFPDSPKTVMNFKTFLNKKFVIRRPFI